MAPSIPLLVVHEGETVQINLINGEGAEHDIVVDQYGARSSRVIGKGASSAVTFTASKTGEFAYYCSAPGHREAGMQGRIQVAPGRARRGRRDRRRCLARPDRPAPADRRARAADRARGPAHGRASGPIGRQDHIQLLDFQRQSAGSDASRARRRHGRGASQERRKQRDDPFGRFSRGDRSGRRLGIHPDRSRRGKDRDLQGAHARSFRLSLRDAERAPAHHQRHVRHDPGGARGRPAAGRSRILCHARRDLYRPTVRRAGRPGDGLRES